MSDTKPPVPIKKLHQDLLGWYDRHARTLPWRVSPNDRKQGVVPDPYRVWLSEIMLQQTVVKAAAPYFDKFTQKWPTVTDLAAASLEDVMAAWAGLGYYSRARNLHACAVTIADDWQGQFPDNEKDLLGLPGIGPYTAAAISTIAFNRPANVVDGNVERVMARLHNSDAPIPSAKKQLAALAAPLVHRERPGDYAQALMDLGATICTPRKPACSLCPWTDHCAGRKAGSAADLPMREKKKPKPVRTGTAYWVRDGQGKILLVRRPEKGLLAKMMGLPTMGWETATSDGSADPVALGLPKGGWRALDGEVRHVFTHFELRLQIKALRLKTKGDSALGHWIIEDDLADAGLPSVMRKVARLALSEGG